MKNFTVALLAALSLGGCAAPVLKLPAESPVSITVLSGARHAELGRGEYLIPGSQVLVGGRVGGYNIAMFMGGGLIPALFGEALTSARNAALNAEDLGTAAPSLTAKFNTIVVEALQTEPAGTAARGPQLRLARANDRDAAIELEPIAHVWLKKPDALVMFQLNANFDVAGVRGRMNRIQYAHGTGAPRPLTDARKQGWADQGGALFRGAGNRAFVRMTDVFKAELRGDLKRDSGNLKRVRWDSPNATEPQSGLLLYEQADFVAVIPIAGDREPARNATLIIDRSQLRAD